MRFNLRSLHSAALLILLSFVSFHAKSQGGQIWGVTGEGGASNIGVIFKTTPTGSGYSVIHEFEIGEGGANPGATQLLLVGDIFYGVASRGGSNDMGVLYSYDPATNVYLSKINFTGDNGSYPSGTLMRASNGKIYGSTPWGGSFDHGGIFEYDIESNTLELKIHFSGPMGSSNSTAGLAEGSDGNLYGVRPGVGSQSKGVIFVFDPVANTYTEKFNFTNDADGRNPMGVLFPTADGKFYGAAESGGANNGGVIFLYDPENNAYTKKVDMTSSTGVYPRGYFVAHPNGKLYGLTQSGGDGIGVLFEYDMETNTYLKKVDFTSGKRPNVTLVVAENGKLYGMTNEGGPAEVGVLFEYDPVAPAFAVKFNFQDPDGRKPYGALAIGPNGKIYGTTSEGGTNDGGLIFEYDSETGVLTTKSEFSGAPGGAQPNGTLVEFDGKLYGLTTRGGDYGSGTIFEIDPATNAFTKRKDLEAANGKYPLGSLLLASNGKFYGMTSEGGENNFGVLFEYIPSSNTYTVKMHFNEENGRYAQGNLTEASNGKLYGLTSFGGENNLGVLFEYDPSTNDFIKKLDFDDQKGGHPFGTMKACTNGKLYGLTTEGGSNGYGVLFEYDPTESSFEKKVEFNFTNGANPFGSFLLASNGKLYGVAAGGGSHEGGVLFEYVPGATELSVKVNFDDANGTEPTGDLIESSSGKLFGMTSYRGVNGVGALYSFTPSSSAFAKVRDFVRVSGAATLQNSLAFIKSEQTIDFPELVQRFLGDAPFTLPMNTSGHLPITYESSNPEIVSIEGNVVTIHKEGTVSILASQPGNAGYKPAVSIEQSLNIKLRSPFVITVTEVSESGFTLNWSAVTGAVNGYQVDISADNFETFIEGYESKAVDDTLLVLTSLPVNAAFQCRVRAVGETGASENSEVISVLTIFAPVPKEATDVTETGFVANWNPVSQATSYWVEVISDDYKITLTALTGTNHVVGGFKPDTEVKYRVKAVNENGSSVYSDFIYVTTLPEKIEALDAIGIAQTRFVAKWRAASRPMNYSFELSSDSFKTLVPGYDPIVVSETLVIVSGLELNTTYYYRIKTINAKGDVQYSNTITVTTLPKQIQEITFSAIENKSLEDESFKLVATTNSGLPVTFTSTSGEIGIDGDIVTILKAGTVEITAIQGGDDLWASAEKVQTFCINPAVPSIRFSEDGKSSSLEIIADETQSITWFKDDVAIKNKESNLLEVTVNGIYTVSVSVDGCTSKSAEFPVLFTGNETYRSDSFELHPNPVSEKLYVIIPPFKGSAQVNMISINGVQVKSFNTSKTHNEIDVRELVPGTYVLRIITSQRTFNGKFLKK
jgi:uncharacterized repeat protein (TIGR03803 family)